MLRLAIFLLLPEEVEIVGPLGFRRPLARVIPGRIGNEEAERELNIFRALLRA